MPPSTLSRRDCLALALLGLGAAPVGARPDAPRDGLPVLSYYDYPPFSTGPGQGLTAQLLTLLHERAEGQLPALQAELLPRKRVAARVGQPGWFGLVPWVSPTWFMRSERQRFIWSEPLMQDEDLVLSLRSRPVDYQGPASLKGLRLGGVFGHVYAEVDPLVETGEIQRVDSFSQDANLRMLLMGRVDAVFVSRSGLAGWRQRLPGFEQRVQTAAQPRMRYQRHLMLSPLVPEAQSQRLLQTVAGLAQDPSWRAVLQQHGVDATTA